MHTLYIVVLYLLLVCRDIYHNTNAFDVDVCLYGAVIYS